MAKRFFTLISLLSATIIFSSTLYQGELENGLRYFIYSDDEMATSNFNIYVNTGSNTEGVYGGAGISHYVEHLIAGGSTPYNDEKAYNDTLQSIGASMNAYTSNEVTCYFISSSEEFKETAIRTLSEWVLHCSFDSFQVEREKGVIEKEIIMYDTPATNIYYSFMDEVFKNSSGRFPVTGYLDVFKSIKRENILDYYNRMYVPENMTIVCAGNLDIKETKELIENNFNTERRFFKEEQIGEPDYSRGAFYQKRNFDILNKKVYIGYYLDYDSPQQRAEISILSYMLSENSDMLLNRELSIKRRLANSITVYTENMTDLKSVFTVYLETDSSAENLANSADSLINLIEKSSKFKKDFEMAKSAFIADRKFMTLNSFNAVSMIYDGYVKFSDPEYFLKETGIMENVKYEDIQNLIKNYFKKPMVLTAEKFDDDNYPERKNFKIVNFEDEALDNGNSVRFYETTANDYSLIFISFPFGYKDGVKPGSTSLIQNLLNEKIEMSDFIKKTNSRHYVIMNNDNTVIGLKIVSDKFKEAADYLTQLTKEIRFSQEMFNRHKSMLKNSAKNRIEDPADIAVDDFQRFFVKNGEYAAFPTETEIENITLDDINGDIKNLLSGNQKIYLWGSMDKNRARDFAKNIFKSKKIFKRDFAGYNEFKKDSNNTENNQSNIYIAYFTDEKFTDKELYSLTMFASFFRGNKSMIHEALRGDNDLVYYGYGYLTENSSIPAFIMNAQTSDEKTEKVISVMESVFDKIARGDFDDNELAERKNEQLLRMRFDFTNPERTLISDISDSYGPFKDKKYYLNEKIGWVTKDDMLNAVKKLAKYKSTLIYR